VRNSSSDKFNFERFGGTFRNGAFWINWKGKPMRGTLGAAVFFCLLAVLFAHGLSAQITSTTV